jgi:Xaa-Pro dipeptidase
MNNFEGTLILRKNKKPVWISHPFNYTQAKKEFSKNLIVTNYEKNGDFEKIIKKYCGKKIGYDAKFTSVSGFKNLKKMLKGKILIDVSKELGESRTIKTSEEILKIKKAVTETKKVIVLAKKKLKNGITEKEIEQFFKSNFEKDGFETAFCIVAFNQNTKNLHHVSGNKKLSEGEVLIDVGAKYDGYTADISESFWFGKTKSKQKTDYERELHFVKNKLEIIENRMKPGVIVKKLFELCTGLNMPHALGHGIGLEEHDYPSAIGKKSNWKLREGMILAIEPGTYDKFGIRIERDYLITKKGCKEL